MNTTDFSLITPTFLFSAISLLMLAYTNRFLAYASLIRSLHDKFSVTHKLVYEGQIRNLKQRLELTQYIQMTGIASLLVCIFSMMVLLFVSKQLAIILFFVAMILLGASLFIILLELRISIDSLKEHIKDMNDTVGTSKDL